MPAPEEANGPQGLEHKSNGGQPQDADVPVQEQHRIAQLAKEGLALVDAALDHGHEGADQAVVI